MKKNQSLIGRMLQYFWSIFLNGLIALLPIGITVALFTIAFRVITGWLEPLRRLVPPSIMDCIPYAEVLTAILFIFLIGTILKVFVLRSIIHLVERWVARLPLVRPIYTGVKQLVKAFSFQDQISFKKVVMVEFPRPGIYSIGFLTSEMLPEIAPNNEHKYFNVFIPTTPNPTSGFLVVVPEKEIIVVNISRQEAMAMVISGGIIQPNQNLQ
jgi:uncharacterized membrane protein